jgi:hypothetical protein
MHRLFLTFAAVCLTQVCSGQDIQVPANAVAGEEATISTNGSGGATFYLMGPGVSRKSNVNLGEEIRLHAQDLRIAGAYQAAVCASTCRSVTFYVNAAKPASLAFLVHPSRVPVAQGDAVSGVALAFDQFHNLVLIPATINFQLSSGTTSLLSRAASTQGGVAWFRTTSGRAAGMLQVVASSGDLSARRAVQQVASDPCNLRLKGERTKAGIVVQTEPVHDCAGNVVPDGTIVTFTATEASGKSTVDAPIKQGIAKAQMAAPGAVIVSVASGVVMGNELRLGAQP